VPFEILSQKLGVPADRIVKVDANENPYGPSPKAIQALAAYPYYHIYPDPNHTLLREALQSYVGVNKDHLLLGTGSDELLDVVMRLFIQPGDAILNFPPTFGMYPFLAGVAGARTVSLARRPDFSLPIDEIERLFQTDAAPPKMIFVASPNNPDGSALDKTGLLRLLALPAVVVVDQAYVEFGGTDFSAWVPRHANLVVMRTFSKWAGLAGLRVGYGVFPAPLMPHLLKIKQPYNVNAAAQTAVLASLDDLDRLQAHVQAIVRERATLLAGLRAISYLAPYPSQSNFVLNRVLGRNAGELKATLEAQGILVRYYRTPELEDCIRISVGTPEQNARVLEALRSEEQ
jgi:histidinol-phosphate aminotransferase